MSTGSVLREVRLQVKFSPSLSLWLVFPVLIFSHAWHQCYFVSQWVVSLCGWTKAGGSVKQNPAKVTIVFFWPHLVEAGWIPWKLISLLPYFCLQTPFLNFFPTEEQEIFLFISQVHALHTTKLILLRAGSKDYPSLESLIYIFSTCPTSQPNAKVI